MKIMIVSRGIPSNKYPMNGIFEMDQAIALAKYGHEVFNLAIDLRSIRRSRRIGFEKIERNGVIVYSLNLPIGRMFSNVELFVLKKCFNYLFKKAVSDYGLPDVVHAHFPKLGCSVEKIKIENQIPVIVSEHSSGFGESNVSKRLVELAVEAYSGSRRVISVSKSLQKTLLEKMGVESIVIPNIVDTSMFRYNPNISKNEVFTFVSIGNLIKRKRMDLTLEAFHEVIQKGYNANLIIIGDGPEKDNLINYVKSHSLQNKVILTGRLDRKAISKYLEKSNCFVLASEAETFGVVYIEALACGLPVIATKCRGPEDFVNSKNGILIEVGCKEELIHSMIYMMDYPDRFISYEISKETDQLFSQSSFAKSMTCVYEQVCFEMLERRRSK